MPDRIARSVTLAIAATLATCAVCAAADPYGIGRPATPQEIASWDIDISPSGAGLPPGRGDVRSASGVQDHQVDQVLAAVTIGVSSAGRRRTRGAPAGSDRERAWRKT